MKMVICMNFLMIFNLLKEWFDTPTPGHEDFDCWRHSLYHEERRGLRDRLPLKTWWPHYTKGDFRFEQIIGGLLVQQTSWRQVRASIEAIGS